MSTPPSASSPPAIVPAVTHSGEGIATKSTQDTHFSVSTILLVVVAMMIGLLIIICIWYFWFHNDKINKKFDEMNSKLSAHAHAPSVLPIPVGESNTPTISGGAQVTVTTTGSAVVGTGSGATGSGNGNAGSTTRAGCVTIVAKAVTDFNAAGSIVATINYVETYLSPIVPVVVLTNKQFASGDLTPHLSIGSSSHTGFTVVTGTGFVPAVNDSITFCYQTFGIN